MSFLTQVSPRFKLAAACAAAFLPGLAACLSAGPTSSSGTTAESAVSSTGAASSGGSSLSSSGGTAPGSSSSGSATGGTSSGAGTTGTSTGAPPVYTLAGGGPGASQCYDGGFDAVEDVRLGPDGTVYVLGSQVYRVDASGSIGIVVPSAVLPGMDEIAIGADGGIYLSAYQPGNPYLTDQIYAVQNGVASLLAGNGGAACGVSGSDAGVGFARVGGLVMDTDGSLVVADINLGSPPALAVCTNLLKVAPDGTTTNLAGNGMRGDREGAGAQAEFSYPLRPAVDGLGNIFVSDVGNYSIRKIAPDGTTSTFAGNGAQGFGDGVGAVVEFGSPAGIAIDASGNLYVADTGNSCIRKITPQGVVSTVAGNGTPGSVNGTLGRGGTTEFDSPLGVAVTPDGSRIYVAEAGNCAVRVIEVDLQ